MRLIGKRLAMTGYAPRPACEPARGRAPVFLPQVVRVVGSREASRQIAYGQRLDTVQGMEVLKRLRHASVRHPLFAGARLFRSRLVRLDELPARAPCIRSALPA